jgi:hypothetical protein
MKRSHVRRTFRAALVVPCIAALAACVAPNEGGGDGYGGYAPYSPDATAIYAGSGSYDPEAYDSMVDQSYEDTYRRMENYQNMSGQ